MKLCNGDVLPCFRHELVTGEYLILKGHASTNKLLDDGDSVLLTAFHLPDVINLRVALSKVATPEKHVLVIREQRILTMERRAVSPYTCFRSQIT